MEQHARMFRVVRDRKQVNRAQKTSKDYYSGLNTFDLSLE